MSTQQITLAENPPDFVSLPPLIRQYVSLSQGEISIIRRQRLYQPLDQATSQYPVTLLIAPAGSGKTALLRGWAVERAASGMRLAWISLSPLLDTPLPLAGIILASLIQAQVLPPSPPDWVRSGVLPLPYAKLVPGNKPPLLPSLAWALNCIAESSVPLTLIIDGYEAITDPATHTLIDLLIEHAPSQLHLVITSRVEPALPVSRLRASGRLTEIPATILRWEVDEAAQLLPQVNLSQAQLTQLVDYTEGWSTGLYLAGLALRSGPDLELLLEEFLAGHRFVFDYLRDEVLDCEKPALQAFLLKSALLHELSAEICEDVLADGEPGQPNLLRTYGGYPSGRLVLDAIMRHSLFLEPISRRSGFFQYHPLFAQMLNIELTRRFPLWVEPLRASFAEYQAPPAPPGRISSAAVTEPLSEREREIVNLMALGCSNRDIAGRLSIVEGTVKTHLKHIFGKLGASNRTEAVAIARSLLIIS